MNGVRDAVLSDQLVRQFRKEGWIKVDRLLEEDALIRVQKALDVVLANEERFEGEQAYRADPRFRSQFANLRHRPQETRELNIGWNPKLGEVARILLGVEHVQLFAEGGVIKPARQEGARATRWHQDLPRQPFDRRDALTIWIAAEDIGLERGPLAFLPGSHRLGPLGRLDMTLDGQDDIYAKFTDADLELVGRPVTHPLRAGDATIHCALLFHSAGSNESDRPRRAWAVTYMSSETLYNGAPSGSIEGVNLKPNQPFDRNAFPLVA